jgi:beta-galactosidase
MPPADSLHFGAAYYPEHVTTERVAEDARLMKEAGVNLVRMGEFSWIRMEPEEGGYDFSWLDHAVETLAAHGVKSLLCTPTATPPKWVMDKYPDVHQFHADGRRREFGGRRHYCVNSPSYRRLSVRIAEAIGNHYAGNPHVIGYQIDNELMAEDPYCHCPTCVEAFRGWLRKKFGTVEELNRRWGLDFWSQCYRSFDEVALPRINAHQSPSSTLDLQRFFSECFVNYAALQGEALRRSSPGKTITHNVCSCGFLYRLDLNHLAGELDIVSVDNYPVSFTFESEYGNSGDVPYHPSYASLALGIIRGTKKAPFWVTEAQSGRTMRPRKLLEPGFLGAITRQELAHGARSVLFFSWRVFASGVEFMLAGVLPSDSKPRRTYREIAGIIRDSRAVSPELAALMPRADVAILRDFDCDWALDDGLPHPDFRYLRHLHRYYQALFENHVNVDILSPEEDFGSYRILIAPSWILIDEARSEKLRDFVHKGGTLVLTCLSAMRDHDNRNRTETLPSLLSGLCGIEVEEQQPLKFQDTVLFRPSHDASGEAHQGSYWFDLLSLHGAEVLAAYDDRWFPGVPAVTGHRTGKGRTVYVGTVPDIPYLRFLLSGICRESGILPNVTEPSSPLIESLKVFGSAERENEHLHLVNFTPEPQSVTLPRPYLCLPDGTRMEGRVSLPPYGSLFLKKIA